MNTRIQALLTDLREKTHVAHRRPVEFRPAAELAAEGLSPMKRVTSRLAECLAAERPVIRPLEQIVFLRTVSNSGAIFTDSEWRKIKAGHFIHEAGRVCNICPDYATTIGRGLLAEKEQCLFQMAEPGCSADQAEFYACLVRSIDAVLDLAERYRLEAVRLGRSDVADMLAQVPARGAQTFPEALQALRILHFTLWCEGEYHLTLGRFDQYLYPYYLADIRAGRLDSETALEWVEDFFIALNKDSDLYPGVQQGDNGQSLMLGGVSRDGRDGFNDLSRICLQASCELKLIDPKINLRVNAGTPLTVFESGSLLTREGLGFPQYANDDVVIPGLIRKGYSPEDARDYTVAACWEFIVPGYGMDIPNIGAVNLPQIVNDCVQSSLAAAPSFASFFDEVRRSLTAVCRQEAEKLHDLYLIPAPCLSMLMDRCLDRGRDISLGGRYNNYGFHGVGISTAVDALAAIKTAVFEERWLAADTLKAALLDDFAGYDELFARLRYQMPKFGDDLDPVDAIAVDLLAACDLATGDLVNERGGCFRFGTGSAMYYLWFAGQIGATAGGHRRGNAFAANYSPELFVKNRGPLSVIRSFTKPDLSRVINGGPLTMEFHASIFRDPECIRKVAMLVQLFIRSGGHQIQLNAVNRDILLEAQKKPEEYRNLIVRVWGWSAYFIELDKEYQDHVIARQEYVL